MTCPTGSVTPVAISGNVW